MRREQPPRIALRHGDDSSVRVARRSESRLTESAAPSRSPSAIVLPPHHSDSVRHFRNQASSRVFDAATVRRVRMAKTTYTESAHTADATQPPADTSPANDGLPNRLMTAFEVAEFVGCHEETVRRAYLRGLLVSQRFGVRGRRFRPTDVLEWIRRGAPTRVS